MKLQISWKYPETNFGKFTNQQYIKWLERIGYTTSYESGDLLVLIGGADIGTNLERDAHELKLIDKFIENGKPIFGICRGMQLLGLRYGCDFVKHIPDIRCGLNHLSDSGNYRGNSSYHKIIDNQGNSYIVNSRHHQGFIKSTDHNMFCEEFCWSEDRIVEGIRGVDYTTKFSGLQFHPEREEVWNTDAETIARNEIYSLIEHYGKR